MFKEVFPKYGTYTYGGIEYTKQFNVGHVWYIACF